MIFELLDNGGQSVKALVCPVCGSEVCCTTTYRTRDGRTTLVGFECNMEGRCGIPAWDPCPLYVTYREHTEYA